MTFTFNKEIEEQINECLNLLKTIFQQDLLGVYLYGSAILGGLHKYSDIDLFIVVSRPTTHKEKVVLATRLLNISGNYMKSKKLPIEMTIVEKSAINPWHYPPKFDFQYGDWLRKAFESGNYEPWPTTEMPDLAVLITQILLASETIMGPNAQDIFCKVPYADFIKAISDSLHSLIAELHSDTRNVLLTLARIWSTLETDTIHSKPDAARWVITSIPKNYRPVLERGVAIYQGEKVEYWDDLGELIKACADFMLSQINKKISEITLSDHTNQVIKLA